MKGRGAVGVKVRVLPLTTAGVVAVRSPLRWRLWTFSAALEPAVSAWLNVTCTGLVREAERALLAGDTPVMVGPWARTSPGRASKASSSSASHRREVAKESKKSRICSTGKK